MHGSVTELIDSHVHLDAADYDADREVVLSRAIESHVTTLITIGASDGIDSAHRAIALAETHSNVWCTVGIHPHCAGKGLSIDEIKKLAPHPRVVGIGETGLDFFRDWAPVADQERFFREQIRLAKEIQKPLIIHSRDAGARCLEILTEERAETIGGVFHCFAEDAAYAQLIWKLNFYVSFPGVITFKKAIKAQEAAKEIPLERILIETDGPYLAPEPFRGKRCESAHVKITAEALAKLKGVTFEAVAKQTTENSKRLFKI